MSEQDVNEKGLASASCRSTKKGGWNNHASILVKNLFGAFVGNWRGCPLAVQTNQHSYGLQTASTVGAGGVRGLPSPEMHNTRPIGPTWLRLAPS